MSEGTGRCFEAAFDVLVKMRMKQRTQDGLYLVHGMVRGGGTRHVHAWVEKEVWHELEGHRFAVTIAYDGSLGYDGEVHETVELPAELYYHYGQVDELIRYTPRQVYHLCDKTGHSGPWVDRFYKVTPLEREEA